MHADLEAIVSSDEAARARVDAAGTRAARQIETARAGIGAAREARRRGLEQEAAGEIAAILADADREAAAIRERRAVYEGAGSEARPIDRAVERFVRIVRDGPGEGGP
jgi:hypothetical protein